MGIRCQTVSLPSIHEQQVFLSLIRPPNSNQEVRMPTTPRMRKSNEKNAKNITKCGNVSKSSKKDDAYPVSPELIALFLFVVIGSAVFQIVQSIWMAARFWNMDERTQFWS